MNTLDTNTYKLSSITRNNKTRRLEISFGDGYKQITDDGINSDKDTYNLVFTLRSTTDAKTLTDWFIDNSTEGFYWMAPGATTSGIYTTRDGEVNSVFRQGSISYWEVSTTLERIYRLV